MSCSSSSCAPSIARGKGLLVAAAAVLAAALALGTGLAAPHDWFQGFEEDTDRWGDWFDGSVHRVPSGYANAGGYADGIASAGGDWHARLRVGLPCEELSPEAPEQDCVGPFTDWNGFNASPAADGYLTSIDIYLDVAWAGANPDVRFDYSSAVNDHAGDHLQDFVFNAGTHAAGQAAFVISASNAGFRASSNPANPAQDPVLVTASGWYTFQHLFFPADGMIVVAMSLIGPGEELVGGWIFMMEDPAAVGGNRYGWFANQEIQDLPVDNARRRSLAPLDAVASAPLPDEEPPQQEPADEPADEPAQSEEPTDEPASDDGAAVLGQLADGTDQEAASGDEGGTTALANVVQHKDDCKQGGWQHLADPGGLGFHNQGSCVSYVASDGRSRR